MSDDDWSSDSDTGRPHCKYGGKCFRQNPDHLKEFKHPKKTVANSGGASAPKKSGGVKRKADDSAGSDDSKATSDDATSDDLPPCPYGAGCYRKNVLHFAEYSHPHKDKALKKAKDTSSSSSSVPTKKDDDKDEGTWNIEDEDNSGPAMLKKSYSSLTEDERKKLVEDAIKLKEKLSAQLKEAEKKEEEVKSLKEKIAKGGGSSQFLDGEEECMKNNKFTIFELKLSRFSTFGDIAEYHYRYAESQFLRLMGGSTNYVVQVDYVVNPPLVKKFQAKQDEFRKAGKDTSHILGFHGTSDAGIDGIVKANFKVDKLGAYTGDKGFYGAGIYFSEYASTSLGYNRSTRMLLSKVILGKQFRCKTMMLGAPLQKGHDSHLSPCGQEVVIYDVDQILPCYIVHFASGQATIDQSGKVTKTVVSKTTKPNKRDLDDGADGQDLYGAPKKKTKKAASKKGKKKK